MGHRVQCRLPSCHCRECKARDWADAVK
jgi:hypothetical protein